MEVELKNTVPVFVLTGLYCVLKLELILKSLSDCLISICSEPVMGLGFGTGLRWALAMFEVVVVIKTKDIANKVNKVFIVVFLKL